MQPRSGPAGGRRACIVMALLRGLLRRGARTALPLPHLALLPSPRGIGTLPSSREGKSNTTHTFGSFLLWSKNAPDGLTLTP